MNVQRLYLNLADAIRKHGQPVCMTTDPEAWYPEKQHMGPHNRKAIELCNQCPVRQQCLEYAVFAPETYGIWGGLLPRQRLALRNAARKRAA